MKLSLHFGLNAVSPAAYGGWSGELNACVNDASDLATLAGRAGYEARAFFNDNATRDSFRRELVRLAEALKAGDALLLTYSGHGGQIAAPTEPDGRNETLCFYDGELIDDELNGLLASFLPGVRIAIVFDSCHSGGMERAVHSRARRSMPASVARILRDRPKAMPHLRGGIEAGVLMLCACAESETALDGEDNGAFTESLLKTQVSGFSWSQWFTGAAAYCAAVHPQQHPVARQIGADTLWLSPALT